MGRLSQREIDELVHEPVISVLSTVRPDGSPHMTPVWHLSDDAAVVIAVEESSVKARNVRREPKVALCVATAETPQRWALVNGTAVLSDEAVSAKRYGRCRSTTWAPRRAGRMQRMSLQRWTSS